VATVHDFRTVAEQRYEELRRRCRICFATTPFDGTRYLVLCEQRRRAKLRLHRIDSVYRQNLQAQSDKTVAATTPEDMALRQ